MRIQTRGNSTTVWLSSNIGVIDGTMTMSAPTLEKILQAVNEKYGTSFEGWSQLPTAYEVGDTVPNWNAYEKIEMPPEGDKLKIALQGYFVVGYDKDNIFSYYITNEGAALFNADGEVVSSKEINSQFNNEISMSLYYGGYDESNPIPMQNIVPLGWKVSSWSEFKEI